MARGRRRRHGGGSGSGGAFSYFLYEEMFIDNMCLLITPPTILNGKYTHFGKETTVIPQL